MLAQFFACAYSKRAQEKIKNDKHYNRYLKSLSRKFTIESKDIKFLTPLGQILYDFLKEKEDILASVKETPTVVLRNFYIKHNIVEAKNYKSQR